VRRAEVLSFVIGFRPRSNVHTWKTYVGSIREKVDLATKGEVVRRVGLSCVILKRRKEGSRCGKREGKKEGEKRERERERERERKKCYLLNIPQA